MTRHNAIKKYKKKKTIVGLIIIEIYTIPTTNSSYILLLLLCIGI